jgi:MFS family permease
MRSRYGLAAYLSGATAARMGDEMSGPALLLLALAVTGSPAEASLVLAGLTISTAVGGPVLGAVLDRVAHPGRILGLALVYYGATVGVVALLLGRAPLFVAVAVGMAAGFAGPALTAGWTAQLAKVMPGGTLTRAYALDAATYNTAGLVGPGLAGIVATWWGAGWSVVLAIVLIVLAMPVAVGFRSAPVPLSPVMVPPPREPLRQALLAGLRIIGTRRPLLTVTVRSVVSFFGFGALIVAVPLLGQQLTGHASLGAVLLSVMATAALVATAATARFPLRLSPDRLAQVATGLIAAALLVLVLTRWPALVVAAFVLVGLADGPLFAAVLAIRHREAPRHLHAQVFTTAASLKTGAFAIGAALGGWLAGHSVGAALAFAAGCQLLAVVLAAVITRSGPAAETPGPEITKSSDLSASGHS